MVARPVLGINFCCFVIYSCFVLHNICEQNKSYVDEDLVKRQLALQRRNEQEHRNVPDPVYSCDTGEGEVVRKHITEYFAACLS